MLGLAVGVPPVVRLVLLSCTPRILHSVVDRQTARFLHKTDGVFYELSASRCSNIPRARPVCENPTCLVPVCRVYSHTTKDYGHLMT